MARTKLRHTRACPHECEACKAPKPKWDFDLWLDGGCPICGKKDRHGTAYACEDCYDGLGHKEEKELIAFLDGDE